MLERHAFAIAIITACIYAILQPQAEAADAVAGASSATAQVAESSDPHSHATTGFYPIWENTGYVQPHREIFIGTTGAQFGIGNVAHVGVQPINFIYRTPNAYAKFLLRDQGRWHVATQAGFYQLEDAASRSFWSPMYSSRIDNPDFSITLVPVSLAATYEASDWLQLHQTVTALGVMSNGPLKDEVNFGYSVAAEFNGRARHSVLLHAMEVGFWNHDFAALGTSYRYHNSWMEFRLGYFYRMRADGQETSPLIGLGVYL